MAQFEPFEEGVEVNGRTIAAFVKGCSDVSEVFERQAREILADNGIEDPEPDAWYSQRAWLESFRELDDAVGRHTLKNVGKMIPESAEFPPGIETVEDALRAIDDAYHRNHRGGEIGRYAYEATGDGARVVCENPYPCPFDRGIIEAAAKRVATDPEYVTVAEDGETCRTEGGDVCTYTVRW